MPHASWPPPPPPPTEADAGRAPPAPLPAGPGDAGLALLLSGGGFRALLFHLGVVEALAEAGLLRQVRQVVGVSGGSILAAHLRLRWGDYVGGRRRFRRAARELLAFARSDVRGHVVRILWMLGLRRLLLPLVWWLLLLPRWLLGWPAPHHALGFQRLRHLSNATGSLARQLEGLLGTGTLAELAPGAAPGAATAERRAVAGGTTLAQVGRWLRWAARSLVRSALTGGGALPRPRRGLGPWQRARWAAAGPSAPPRTCFLATNLSTSEPCGFDERGWLTPFRLRGARPGVGAGLIRVAEAVAASTAFPAFFPPVRLVGGELGWLGRRFGGPYQFVSDGGVWDNLGLEALPSLPPEIAHVVVSDGSGSVDWETQALMTSVLGSAGRTVNLLLERVKRLSLARLKHANAPSRPGAPAIHHVPLDVATVGEDPAHLPAPWPLLRRVRTDLDAFEPEVIRALVEFGHRQGTRAAAGLPGAAGAGAPRAHPWVARAVGLPLRATGRERNDVVREARRTRWRLVRWDDWATWVNVPLLLIAALGLVDVARHALAADGLQERADGLQQAADDLQEQVARARASQRWDEVSEDLGKLDALQEDADWLPEEAVDAAHVPPTLDGLDVLYDRRTFDLSALRADGAAPGARVRVLRTLHIEKRSDDVRLLRVPFGTSGQSLRIAVQPRVAGCRVERFPSQPGNGFTYRDLLVPLHGWTPGQRVVLSVLAEFEAGGFQAEADRWVGAIGPRGHAALLLGARFAPGARPAAVVPGVAPFKTPHDARPLDGEASAWAAPQAPHVWLLDVPKPQGELVYRLAWRW